MAFEVVICVETGHAEDRLCRRLADAWIYLLRAGSPAVEVLRTDAQGKLRVREQTGGRPASWEFGGVFTADANEKVRLCYSRGARPVPVAQLGPGTELFFDRVLRFEDPPAGAADVFHMAPNTLNTLACVPVLVATIPERYIGLSSPGELQLWPISWAAWSDAYYTEGFPPGPLWGPPPNPSRPFRRPLNVQEGDPAPAAPADARPRERGLLIRGVTALGTTSVRLSLVDARAQVVQLRPGFASTAAVQHVEAELKVVGQAISYSARVFLADQADGPNGSAKAFGPVQLVVRVEGGAPARVEAFTGYLCGVQIGLLDDAKTPAGQPPPAPPGEVAEKIVVDFTASPSGAVGGQAADQATRGQTRVRRMVVHEIGKATRALRPDGPAPNATQVARPQMPMWMAELQLVGIERKALQELMADLFHSLPQPFPRPAVPSVPLILSADWQLKLGWKGPDAGTSQRQAQGSSYALASRVMTTAISLYFGEEGLLLDQLDAAGVARNTFDEEPFQTGSPWACPKPLGLVGYPAKAREKDRARTRCPFPVADRRLPEVVPFHRQRAWGRQQGATLHPSLVVELQPRVVGDHGEELIRGGDGQLLLHELTLNGQPVLATQTQAPATKLFDLAATPMVRVGGVNPTRAEVEALLGALVEDYFNRHRAEDHVAALPLAAWRETLLAIVRHECGSRDFQHFDVRSPLDRIVAWGSRAWGLQRDLPVFGPPHGYGLGQLDLLDPGRGVSTEETFSFLANLQTAVELVMRFKARAAYAMLAASFPAALPPSAPQAAAVLATRRRMRAVYQREIVRRYNGFQEFTLAQQTWKISPHDGAGQDMTQWADASDHSKGPYPNLFYPNQVLTGAAAVTYTTGQGAQTQFPWPVDFLPANYTPETAPEP